MALHLTAHRSTGFSQNTDGLRQLTYLPKQFYYPPMNQCLCCGGTMVMTRVGRKFCSKRCKWRGASPKRQCPSCGKTIPKSNHRNQVYCNPACIRASWSRKCKWCGIYFRPPERRGVFCGRSCAASWKNAQPSIMAKMVGNKDWSEIARKVSESIMSNPSE